MRFIVIYIASTILIRLIMILLGLIMIVIRLIMILLMIFIFREDMNIIFI